MLLRRFVFIFLLIALPFSGVQAQTSEQSSLEAEIVEMQPAACAEGKQDCFELRLVGKTGDAKGQNIIIQTDNTSFVGGKAPVLQKGDRVILLTQNVNGQQKYVYSDLVRRPVLLWLLLFFIGCALLVGGKSALRSLAGMALSLFLIFAVMLPRFLAGDPPLLVALIGGFIIMSLTFLITHGWGPKSMSALLGTTMSLLLTGLLAVLFAQWARLFGLGEENAVFLLNNYPDIDTRGLLLAGIIIGALGTLDDVTIAQSSAVFELKAANPAMTAKHLYASAIRIGRDHIAGAINTLVLAYAGAALPLLLLLASNSSREPWLLLISRETFATEIVRTIVGSLGLLAAVPFTTFVASWMAMRMPASALRRNAHAHHHH